MFTSLLGCEISFHAKPEPHDMIIWRIDAYDWFDGLFSVFLQEAQKYAQENGLFFMETSAKNATNVNDIFYEIGIAPV